MSVSEGFVQNIYIRINYAITLRRRLKKKNSKIVDKLRKKKKF